MTKAELEAQLKLAIEIHEYAAKPYHDQNDIKGFLTARKHKLRKEIARL